MTNVAFVARYVDEHMRQVIVPMIEDASRQMIDVVQRAAQASVDALCPCVVAANENAAD